MCMENGAEMLGCFGGIVFDCFVSDLPALVCHVFGVFGRKILPNKSTEKFGPWAHGPWALGPWALGPWALGPWALGPWARTSQHPSK